MQSGWQRWIPLTGIVAAVLLFIGFMLTSGPSSTGDNQKLLAWYADSGHQTTVILGAYLMALAGVCVLLFMNRLRSAIIEAEGARSVFGPFVFAASAVFVAGLVVAGAAFASVSADVKFGSDPASQTPDVIRAINSLGYGAFMVLGMFPLIFAMFATAYASMRFKIFAGWFNWLTIICGIALFFAVAFIPMVALLIWLIVGSIVLMGHQPAATAATVNPAAATA